MREAPRIRVEAADLGGRPVALYDDLGRFVLGVDFSCPPEQIVAAMENIFQECVDSGRWSRNDSRGHSTTDTDTTEETRSQH